ncbi:hypothetical protein ACIQNG_22125, partial [Streptomyces sp. NPDC091377]|uniref:hypothetical protein n=1 Tax=Streptomyces sp. NPDC091377 TaxID=3365995 RepID=UPI0038217AA1
SGVSGRTSGVSGRTSGSFRADVRGQCVAVATDVAVRGVGDTDGTVVSRQQPLNTGPVSLNANLVAMKTRPVSLNAETSRET